MRDYWRLWVSSALSNLADGVLKIALPLVAVDYTRSPAAIAGLSLAFTLPWLLFALPAGAVTDRVDRRLAMVVANVARAALLTVLVVAPGTLWVLYAVAFAVGVAETVYDTSAQSIVPQLVDMDQLSKANGRLYAAELTANQFIGPPLGGLLAAAGAVAAFITPTALWVAAVGALLLVQGKFRPERLHRTSLLSDIAEGVRFLWRQRLLRTFAVVVGLYNFAGNAAGALLVLYAVGPMGLSDTGFGVLMSMYAIGSLIGTFFAPWIERTMGRAKALLVTFGVGALSIVAPALTSNPYLIGASFVISGAGVVVSNIILVSLRQRITPNRLLGRVNSGYRLVAWGTMPLGSVVGGALGQAFGLRPVFAIMGVLSFALLLLLLGVTDSAMHAAEATTQEPALPDSAPPVS
ncbi:MFS transporter [Actinokineospora inagensis]|uniref:MFS transporter n=1 Tax=Actinokineospora inagensis TaxID=103730 RepID=UPI00316AC9BB